MWGWAGFKDRDITWRHMANQVSCYEIGAEPGTAFDYNDWQMVGLKSLFDMEKWGSLTVGLNSSSCKKAFASIGAVLPDAHAQGVGPRARP